MTDELNIDDASFGKINPEADSLTIELSEYEFLFCEYNSQSNNALFCSTQNIDKNSTKTVAEQFIYALNFLQISKKNYQHVYINHQHSSFTFCPESFYNDVNAKEILELNIGSINQQIVKINDVNTEIKLIYSVDEDISNTIDKMFPQHKSKHSVCVLTQLLLNSEDLANEDILVYIKQNSITIIIKQDNALLLANTYTVNTNEDILYYLLFAIEQYQLNPIFAKIVLIGNISTTAIISTSIKKYIKHVRFGVGNKTINWSAINGMPQHYYYNLLNRIFCES